MRNKKMLTLVLGVGLLMYGLCACNSSESNESITEKQNTEQSQQVGTETVNTGQVDKTLEEYIALPSKTNYITAEDYALADAWGSTDDTRIANVMKKAERGEKVTIAVLGGSITEGTVSKGEKDKEIEKQWPYANYFKEWWTERFPNSEITFINAGIGGTDSYLGVHRVYEDVLQYKPDLVLVEYAVNDSADNAHYRSYDNLVRRIMKSDENIACMLLFMAQSNGTSAQSKQVFIGFRYSIPMLSYANVLSELLSSGRFTEKELSGDVVHPSAIGHAITGEILWRYLESVYENRYQYGDNPEFDFEIITKEVYQNATIINSENVGDRLISAGDFKQNVVDYRFSKGWRLESGEGNIEIKATFKNLGILYISTIDGKCGQFDIYVDGTKVRTIDANFQGGWGNAINGTEVFTSDEEKEHTIIIKKSPNSTGDILKLLGFMIS